MNKKYWIIKSIGLLFRLLIAGGLVVLLFSFIQKTRAIVSWDGGFYIMETEKYTGREVAVIEDVYNADFNSDGASEKIVLKEGKVEFYHNNEMIFESDPEFDVSEVLIGDFNNDNVLDMGLYLWKVGNYGPDLPFWVDENDDSYRQHLFLYTWREDTLKALWHSSNLPYINVKTLLTDIDGDEENEILVLERPYEWGEGETGEAVAVWKWDEWGFTNQWRSEKGKYDDIATK